MTNEIEERSYSEPEVQEINEALSKDEIVEWEELAKACPRCGGASADSSNASGRCSSCLKKLRTNKKKPGHYLHLHKLADDALRRQKDQGKTKGVGNRKDIMDKAKRAEKKTGQVLSPDRKDNNKGYHTSNVRMIAPHLNRGTHKVDEKKLAAWRSKLKKSEITAEELFTMLLAKAAESADNQLFEVLQKAVVSLDQKDTDTDEANT